MLIFLGILFAGTTILDVVYKIPVPQQVNDVSNVVLTIIISAVGIVFAFYFIYVQIYLNRYPVKLLKGMFVFPIKICLITLCGISIYGLSLILYSNRFMGHIFFWLATLISILGFAAFTIRSVKYLSIKACVIEYVNNVEKSLLGKPTIEEFTNTLEDMYSIYEECITKEEYYICQSISEATQEIFETFLKEQNRLIIDNSLKEQDAVRLSSVLMIHCFKQISCVKDINSPKFVKIVINMPVKYVLTCVRIGQYTLYKKCIKKLASNIYAYLDAGEISIVEKLYLSLDDLVDEIFLKSDFQEWLLYMLEIFCDMTTSFMYMKKKNVEDLFWRLLQSAFSRLKTIENDEYYEKAFKLFSKYVASVIHTGQNLNSIKICILWIISSLIDSKNVKRIDVFDDFFDEIQKHIINNEDWLEILFYYISELKTAMPNEYSLKMRSKNIRILQSIISSAEEPVKPIRILIPDYVSEIEKNKTDVRKIGEYASELQDLCHRAIIRDNTDIYYFLLETLNQGILCLPQNAKEAQMELFSVYYNLLQIVSDATNKLFAEITISKIKYCVSGLDKNKSISRDFAAIIIKNLQDIASEGNSVSDFLRDKIVGLFSEWHCKIGYEMNFLLKDNDTKKVFFRNLYLIGLSCIEYGREESLRKVSNVMGWSFVRMLERKESSETIACLFKLVTSLYTLAEKLDVSKQTLLFQMTLFTTVGTYCESEIYCYSYQNSIIQFLAQYDINFVKMAAQIRTGETSSWDELFKGKTKEYTAAFLNKIQQFTINQSKVKTK